MGVALRITVVAAALAAIAPAGAAALDFRPCPGAGALQCATLTVPIDRSGAVPGTIALHVERIRAPHPSGPPIVALAGGPGETNTRFTRLYPALFGPLLRTHDLVVFDQRGTGRSGAIHCAALEAGQPAAQALPACARQLGAAAHHYTSVDSADDLDSLRAALGAKRVTVFGVSYGTWVAQLFARRHPRGVASLILDSTVGQQQIDDGFDQVFYRELAQGARAYCAPGLCRGLTRDPWADGVRLYRRLERAPLRATWYDGRGRRRTMLVGSLQYGLLVANSDVHPDQRAELPRATVAALHGDGSLLARELADGAAARPTPLHLQNQTLNDATRCEEIDYHYDRSAPPDQRLAQAQAALAAIPASTFAPFGPTLAFFESLAPTCAYWPSLPRRPDLGGPLPDVPALLLHGTQDLRTTPVETRSLARALPHARVLDVPQTGHDTWGYDATGCVRTAVRRFLSGRPVARCRASGRANPFAPRPLPPRSPGAPRGGVPGAVALTVADGLEQLDDVARGAAAVRDSARIGGLRGGYLHGDARGPALAGYSYIRGLRVSGRVRPHGAVRLRVSGRVRGELTFAARGRVTGTLDGRRVRARIRLVRETAYQRLRRRGLLLG